MSDARVSTLVTSGVKNQKHTSVIKPRRKTGWPRPAPITRSGDEENDGKEHQRQGDLEDVGVVFSPNVGQTWVRRNGYGNRKMAVSNFRSLESPSALKRLNSVARTR